MASSAGGQQSPWQYDHTRRMYYRYDARTNQVVYQNGQRLSRQDVVPRTTNVGQQQPQQPSAFSGPTNDDAGWQSADSPPNQYRLSRGSRADSFSSASQAATTSLNQAMGGLNVGTAPTSNTTVRNGITFIDTSNPNSLVRNSIGTSPAAAFTDSSLLQQGVLAHRYLTGTGGGEAEQLYPNYRIKDHSFFCVGRVFLVLWAEPMGETGTVITSAEQADPSVLRGRMGERVYSKVRRFVVVRASANYCSALPIATYGSQGVGKPGVKKSEHAIIHTGRDAPSPQASEAPARGAGESPMRSMPIRVVPDDPRELLDPLSRIDFGKIHTVQHNIKARPMGMVHPSSMNALTSQFDSVWASSGRASSSRTAAAAPPTAVPEAMLRAREEQARPSERAGNKDGSGDDEAEAERALQAQRALVRMARQGHSREDAIAQLISQLRGQGFSKEGATAEIRARLNYRPPEPDSDTE
ncbi:hypothetical protein CLAFUW4_05682 [Fulvia fulva]|nr:hypothetical protein CLAFUR4_05676 [Fulvia fulva]WPV15314.1 hypothetical protein CLAFUW4_05682 [Fulvia fulva]WPV29924.1 hypothetical protein CLAFUW7_05681 [Fulvia fulva]